MTAGFVMGACFALWSVGLLVLGVKIGIDSQAAYESWKREKGIQ
jgi:hypothetical protein